MSKLDCWSHSVCEDSGEISKVWDVERSGHGVNRDNIMRVDSYYFDRYGGRAAFKKIWKSAGSSPFPVGTFAIGHCIVFKCWGFLRGPGVMFRAYAQKTTFILWLTAFLTFTSC